MKRLNPFEQEYSGKNLVEASAGTGKTYNIVWLYLRFLLKENFSVSEILVVTYTKAATKELKERLINRIQDSLKVLNHGYQGSDAMLKDLDSVEWLNRNDAVKKLEEAVRTFDKAAVYTIHGFCKNVLEEMAFESRTSFDAELLSDDSPVIQEIVDDYWRGLVYEAEEDESKALLLQYLMNEKLTPDSLADCLRPYIGKPYIKIIPDEIEWREIETHFQSLQKIYRKLQNLWQEEREEIIALLDPEIMSGYTENNLPGRIETIDELFLNNSASIIDPDNVTAFKYCTRSYISESLLSKAQKEGVQPPNHRFFELMDDYGDICRFLQLTKSVFLKQLLEYLQKKLPGKKEELEVLSYDDLLLNVYRSINDEPSGDLFAELLRQKYPVALVDEFQDTDPVQYDIFRSIYSGNSEKLFMIGDPKQAIYSFRGADIFAYLEARNDTTAGQQFGLSENYRSVPELLTAVNALFSRTENPFVLSEISFNPVEHGHPEYAYQRLATDNSPAEAMQVITLESDDAGSDNKNWSNEIAMAAASDIFELLRKGDEGKAHIGDVSVSARDIAVLVRSHNQADLMNEALATYGIKSVQLSRESVFHTREAHELEQVLAAIAEPGSERLIRGALITSLIGKTANDLYEYEESEEQWVRQVELFMDWNHIWKEHGFSSMFRNMIREEDVALNLMKHRKGERRLTNILHLGELLQQREEEEQSGMRSLIKWMAAKRTEKKDGREEEELRLESDEDLVKIVTMHSSKGLEYPVVFCPFLWKGLRVENSKDPFLFHTGDEKKACLDLTPKDSGDRTSRLAEYYKEDLAESMRLAYVAITRAKQQCNIYWHGETDSSEFSPLGYILLGKDCVTAQIRKKLKLDNSGKEITEEVLNRALKDLQEEIGSKVNFHEWRPSGDAEYRKEQDQREELQVRKFSRSGRIISLQQVSSFSSLTRAGDGEVEIPDYDQYIIPDTGPTQQQPETFDIFSFPRGPQPGTCVHKIFEQIDFTDLSNVGEVIRNGLETYGIDPKWNPVLKGNLLSVINKQLIYEIQDTTLADLNKSDFLHEMEFYFDMEAISNSRVMQIIRQNGSRIQGQSLPGFMKGYIDLTVRFGDRFYIIDYKTNYLGNQPEDYSLENMREEIYEAAYDLQYHIYSVALHRYLKERLSGYRYENHFGGVLYLFLRGINETTDDYRGIYFDRPQKAKIKKLDQYMKTGGIQ